MSTSDIKVRKRIFWAQLWAYVLIVAVASYGFWTLGNQQDSLEATQKQQQIDRCTSGQDLRNATRANIQSVYALALSLVKPQPGDPPPTPEQQAGMDRYLATARAFRDNALSKIPPVSPGCEDYTKAQGGGDEQ